MNMILERPSEKMSQHLKPLYIKAHIDGLLVDRILVDGGSAINVMPQIMLWVLQKSENELIPTKINVQGFTRVLAST